MSRLCIFFTCAGANADEMPTWSWCNIPDVKKQLKLGDEHHLFYLEYAGELCIIALRRRVVKYNMHTTHTPFSTNNTHVVR
jgi:hypothetical protein